MRYSLTCLIMGAVLATATVANARSLPIPDPPALGAKSYVLLDVNSDQVLAAKNPDKRIKPASVTKLLTCYITFDEIKAGNLSIDDQVTVSKKAWKAHGSQMFLRVGNKVSVDELLDGLITTSGNDAAIALAEYIGGTTSTFAGYMNQYAKQLGLTNSHFVNVDGLPVPHHYMSARDIARLQADIVQRFPKLYDKYFHKKHFVYNGIKQYNRNKLLWTDDRVDGGKTGHTKEAGFNLVVSAVSNKMRVVSVVTGTDSKSARSRQADALVNYGFRFFENTTLFKDGAQIAKVRVWKGASQQLPVVSHGPVVVAIPRGKRKQIKTSAKLPNSLVAPVAKGQKVGTLKISYNDKTLRTVALYAGKKIDEGGIVRRLWDDLWMMF